MSVSVDKSVLGNSKCCEWKVSVEMTWSLRGRGPYDIRTKPRFPGFQSDSCPSPLAPSGTYVWPQTIMLT